VLGSVDLENADLIEMDDSSTTVSHDVDEPMTGESGSLVEEEEKATGVVQLGVYQAYWKAVGVCMAPSVLVALFLMQGQCVTKKRFIFYLSSTESISRIIFWNVKYLILFFIWIGTQISLLFSYPDLC